MSSGPQLSQEELDALLAGLVEEENPAAESDLTASGTHGRAKAKGNADNDIIRPNRRTKGKQTPFDPGSQVRIVRERLHSLEIISERFARQFRMNQFSLLRHTVDITDASMRYQ